MRILYVGTPASGAFSGPSVHVREVIKGLTARGHVVEYLPSVRVSGSLPRQIFQRLLYSLELLGRLRRHRPDWVYQREQMADPFIAEVCHQLKIPYAVEVNGLIANELVRGGARPRTLVLIRLLQRWCLRRACRIIVPANNWKRLLSQAYQLDVERIRFIQNGVCLESFRDIPIHVARQQLSLGADDFILGFLGSVYRNYDFEPILHALAVLRPRFPQLKLLVVGPGPQRESLGDRVRKLGLEAAVELVGPVPHETAPQWLSAFDICLMPYCREVLLENNGMFSMKLQEYAAMSRPFLAHDIPGSETREEVMQFGWTFDPSSLQAAVGALEEVLTSSIDERRSKGLSARQYAELHSWDSVASMTEQALQG